MHSRVEYDRKKKKYPRRKGKVRKAKEVNRSRQKRYEQSELEAECVEELKEAQAWVRWLDQEMGYI